MNIACTGGGTGGHIFPAIAIMQELKTHKCVLITNQAFKKFSGTRTDVITEYISIQGMNKGLTTFLYSLLISYFKSLFLLKKHKINLVLAFGGYPTLPVLIAAYHLRIPILLHESNAVLGRVNKLFLPVAKKLAYFFPSVNQNVHSRHQSKLIQTGIPVTKDIKFTTYPIIEDTINIFVVGGSQSAGIFSDVIPEAIKIVLQNVDQEISISQQCHETGIENLAQYYTDLNVTADISNFFHNISEKISQAHIIICRAGASTIAEIIKIGRPAIYTPHPQSKDDHQVKNAEFISKQGGGIMIQQKDFNSKYLAQQIIQLIQNDNQLLKMSQLAHQLSIDNSNEKLAELIKQTIKNGGSGKI